MTPLFFFLSSPLPPLFRGARPGPFPLLLLLSPTRLEGVLLSLWNLYQGSGVLTFSREGVLSEVRRDTSSSSGWSANFQRPDKRVETPVVRVRVPQNKTGNVLRHSDFYRECLDFRIQRGWKSAVSGRSLSCPVQWSHPGGRSLSDSKNSNLVTVKDVCLDEGLHTTRPVRDSESLGRSRSQIPVPLYAVTR